MWHYAIFSARRSRGGISNHGFIFGGLRGIAPEWPSFRRKGPGQRHRESACSYQVRGGDLGY